MMMAIPLYHVYGMVAGMNYGMGIGGSLVMVPDPRDLKDLLGNMQKYKTSIFPAVPALYNAINNNPDVKAGKYDLSAIKACISGSAPRSAARYTLSILLRKTFFENRRAHLRLSSSLRKVSRRAMSRNISSLT